ncbi:MAG: shikimate kinase [Clostridiales bacterium]|nr:shikimate kinase [Clostridiales bacterium]
MPKNIVLVGMPASGKSTIGVILAKELKYRFTDTDLVLQEATDQTLVEIIAQRGLEGFLQLENDTVAALEVRRSVIATGGSVIYGREAMEHLKSNGIIVYIRHRYEVIQSRLTNITTRGVAMREGETLYDLFRERTPLYERYADVTLEADGLTTEQAVQEIIRLVNGFTA